MKNSKLVVYASIVSTLLFTSLPLRAQKESGTSREHMLAIGSAHVLDTYLSPEEYSGESLRYISKSTHRGYDAEQNTWKNWSHAITWSGDLSTTSNRANNADYLGGHVDFQYDWLRNFKYFAVGPMAKASLGGLYNTRNGNNPAQLYASADAGVTLTTGYGFTLFRKPMRLNYDATLPLVGTAFTPQYGQSYYEIFTQGNYDHNIVLTSPFNALTLCHTLTLDVTFKKHTFRIGYLGDYRQREANNLKYHDYVHALLLGYVL